MLATGRQYLFSTAAGDGSAQLAISTGALLLTSKGFADTARVLRGGRARRALTGPQLALSVCPAQGAVPGCGFATPAP